MKAIDLFCSSQASTAICSTIDQRTIVRQGTSPIDHRRKPRSPVHSPSQQRFDPKSHHRKSRKSSVKQSEVRRKSSADVLDLTTPPGSSRYLLSDAPDSDQVSVLVPRNLRSNGFKGRIQYTSPNHPASKTSLTGGSNLYPAFKSSSTSSNKSPVLKSSSAQSLPCNQVVELRVSIHCKGCEGKVRKYISRMEGVTSVDIDLNTKKVTVVGDVTPLGVLTSISRIKNAEFWPSSTSSSSPMIGLR